MPDILDSIINEELARPAAPAAGGDLLDQIIAQETAAPSGQVGAGAFGDPTAQFFRDTAPAPSVILAGERQRPQIASSIAEGQQAKQFLRTINGVDPARIDAMSDNEASRIAAGFNSGPFAPMQAAPRPGAMTSEGEILRSFTNEVARQFDVPNAPLIGPWLHRKAQEADWQAPAQGAAGFVGETLGGLTGMASPNNWMETLGSTLVAGPITAKLAGPLVRKVAEVAGPKIAGIFAHTLEESGEEAAFSFMQQAGKEDWANDPVGATRRTLAAAGIAGAVGGVVGGGMATVRGGGHGDFDHAEHPTETRTEIPVASAPTAPDGPPSPPVEAPPLPAANAPVPQAEPELAQDPNQQVAPAPAAHAAQSTPIAEPRQAIALRVQRELRGVPLTPEQAAEVTARVVDRFASAGAVMTQEDVRAAVGEEVANVRDGSVGPDPVVSQDQVLQKLMRGEQLTEQEQQLVNHEQRRLNGIASASAQDAAKMSHSDFQKWTGSRSNPNPDEAMDLAAAAILRGDDTLLAAVKNTIADRLMEPSEDTKSDPVALKEFEARQQDWQATYEAIEDAEKQHRSVGTASGRVAPPRMDDRVGPAGGVVDGSPQATNIGAVELDETGGTRGVGERPQEGDGSVVGGLGDQDLSSLNYADLRKRYVEWFGKNPRVGTPKAKLIEALQGPPAAPTPTPAQDVAPAPSDQTSGAQTAEGDSGTRAASGDSTPDYAGMKSDELRALAASRGIDSRGTVKMVRDRLIAADSTVNPDLTVPAVGKESLRTDAGSPTTEATGKGGLQVGETWDVPVESRAGSSVEEANLVANIKQGQQRLRTGKDSLGKKIPSPQLEAVRSSVVNAIAKLEEMRNTPDTARAKPPTETPNQEQSNEVQEGRKAQAEGLLNPASNDTPAASKDAAGDSGLKAPPRLYSERDRLRTKLDRLNRAQNAPGMPGTFITGNSGIPASRRRALDRQLDRTIDRAKEIGETTKRLNRVEADIKYHESGKAAKDADEAAAKRAKKDARVPQGADHMGAVRRSLQMQDVKDKPAILSDGTTIRTTFKTDDAEAVPFAVLTRPDGTTVEREAKSMGDAVTQGVELAREYLRQKNSEKPASRPENTDSYPVASQSRDTSPVSLSTLQSRARELGVSDKGTKPVLVRRIREAEQQNPSKATRGVTSTPEQVGPAASQGPEGRSGSTPDGGDATSVQPERSGEATETPAGTDRDELKGQSGPRGYLNRRGIYDEDAVSFFKRAWKEIPDDLNPSEVVAMAKAVARLNGHGDNVKTEDIAEAILYRSKDAALREAENSDTWAQSQSAKGRYRALEDDGGSPAGGRTRKVLKEAGLIASSVYAPKTPESEPVDNKPVAIEKKGTEASEESAQNSTENNTSLPWSGSSVEDEHRWYGTRVTVSPDIKGNEPFTGSVDRVLNGGALVEVKPDGTEDTSWRIRSERVTVDELKDSRPDRSKGPAPTTPEQRQAIFDETYEEYRKNNPDDTNGYGRLLAGLSAIIERSGIKPVLKREDGTTIELPMELSNRFHNPLASYVSRPPPVADMIKGMEVVLRGFVERGGTAFRNLSNVTTNVYDSDPSARVAAYKDKLSDSWTYSPGTYIRDARHDATDLERRADIIDALAGKETEAGKLAREHATKTRDKADSVENYLKSELADAEAELAAEPAKNAESLAPLSDIKPLLSRGWAGAMADGTGVVSDGRAIVQTDSLSKSDAEKLAKPPKGMEGNPKPPASLVDEMWKEAVSSAQDARILGTIESGTDEGRSLLVEYGEDDMVSFSANRIAYLAKVTGADSLRVGRIRKLKVAVLYDGDKPVASLTALGAVPKEMDLPAVMDRQKARERAKVIGHGSGSLGSTPSLSDTAQTNIDAAKDRIKSRRTKRGKDAGSTTLLADTVDTAYIAFWRVVQAGDYSARFIRDQVRFVIKDLGSSADEEQTTRLVNRLVNDGLVDGKITPEKAAEVSGSLINADGTPKPYDLASLSGIPTSARKDMMAEDRGAMGLDALDGPERRSWAQDLSDAVDKGIPDQALRIAADVNQTPRALSSTETAGLVHKAASLKNEHRALMDKIGEATDDADIADLNATALRVEQEFDALSTALRKSGTEKGRALASQKLTLDQDLSLIAVKNRAKAAKGKALTAEEQAKFAEQAAKLEAATARIAELEKQMAEQSAEHVIKRHKAVTRMTEAERAAQHDALVKKAKELLANGCH